MRVLRAQLHGRRVRLTDEDRCRLARCSDPQGAGHPARAGATDVVADLSAGDTLVVDTTNFTDKNPFRGSFENLHMAERFTRIDAATIDYRGTFEDPTAWISVITVNVTVLGWAKPSVSPLTGAPGPPSDGGTAWQTRSEAPCVQACVPNRRKRS